MSFTGQDHRAYRVVDTADTRAAGPMDAGPVAAEMVTWLRGIKWDWFATLTFGGWADGASAEAAGRAGREWMDALRAINVKAYAIVAVESGTHLGGWHVHALVGGTGTHPAWGDQIARLWRAGPAHVVRYNPDKDPKTDIRKGVVPYLHKQGDVEIVGQLRRWRPRKRT